MRGTVLAFAFAILGLLPSTARADDCTLRQFASLPLSTSEDGRPVVDAVIGGRAVRLLVDTGGIYSTLGKAVVDGLNLSQRNISNGMEVYAEDGERIKSYVEAPDFKLGPIALDKLAMMVSPASMDGTEVDGTLSPDFLSRFDIEFDFADRKLNLFSPDHCEGKVVYWSKSCADEAFKLRGAHIVVPVTLDGHDMDAILDTGAHITTISQPVADRTYGLTDSSPGMERVPDAKPDDLFQYRYRFKSLALNGVAVSNPLIYVLPDKVSAGFRREHNEKSAGDAIYGSSIEIPGVILGTNVLSKLHLFISYKEKKLYLTAADAH